MTDTSTTATPKTGADIVKAAYPARYYAQYDTSATGVTHATAVIDTQASDTKVNALPAASDMIALTADQYVMAQGANNIRIQNGALLYPARYYVRYDTTAAQPTDITGWFDTWALSDVSLLPDAEQMLAVSQADWNNPEIHAYSGKGVQDGKIVDYTPPVPLPIQAQGEQTWIASQASMAAAMGETFTSDMKAYVKAVQAIADGADTTSTKLPDRPTDIMS
ncbi:hypothetical protein K6W36_09230 [Acetobacter senegalensis]|uniref:hypothetical protein n=1 Tax=Acetobacter senegalensis TaxID=446692 RepID=UPI001EDC8A78|nr:hypothetical protein [Acetobacter senegalensis]MCG4260768.1 hypothetical protein [Acetobacter senegalensis]